ncbi:hypothetical protein ACRQ5B_02135 [Pseudarthrobacter sp. L19]|uniref:hypothetical protein n=1 Tax=Pseudarthrobacter sp. L19 TaxID=3423951 RepID=UPI003D7AC604
MKNFREHRTDGAKYITLAHGDYYPDALPEAATLYQPVIDRFGELVRASASSEILFKKINRESKDRIQLCRIFRKYVSPSTPVEMLKKKSAEAEILRDFGNAFRPIEEVKTLVEQRPSPDEALCAVLWEYKDRGKKGYDLTEQFLN